MTGNRERVVTAVRDAAATGATLIVLPELCTTGYALADRAEALAYAEPADGPTITEWRELCHELGVTIVAGFCERDAAAIPHNSAAVVDADGSVTIYRKTHLWDREPLLFDAGASPAPVVQTAAGRIGVAICYDAFFPEVMRGLAGAGAEVIAVPMNSPVPDPPLPPQAVPPPEVVLALGAAMVNRVYVAQADRCGLERGIVWSQASAICDPDGALLAGPVDGVGLLRASCDLGRARDKTLGTRNDVFADRRPELYLRPGPRVPRPSGIPSKEMVH